jgi:hypothetical protein
VIVVAIVGLALGLRHWPRFPALVAVWALARSPSAVWVPITAYPRYLVPATPFILLLAAIGVDELVSLAKAITRPSRRVIGGSDVAGILALVPALAFDGQMSYDPASAPYPPLDKVQYITGSMAFPSCST